MSHPFRAAAALLALVPLLAATPAPKAAMHAHPPVAHGPKVVKMADGLQYTDLVVGKGPEAHAGEEATVQYIGTLANGKKFDASLDHQPDGFKFNLGGHQVITCWDEGVASMHVGGKRKLTCPPNIAYGAAGAGGVIPPNATIFFEVQLLSVK